MVCWPCNGCLYYRLVPLPLTVDLRISVSALSESERESESQTIHKEENKHVKTVVYWQLLSVCFALVPIFAYER